MSDGPAAKRLKADDAYKLTYWPGLPGRGEPIRLLFEEAGVDFEDGAQTAEAVPQVLAQIDTANLGDEHNAPPLAPPVLQHGDLLISQTPNILMYLAPKLGLGPPASSDDLYRLNALVLTVFDGLCNEIHDCHHPICTSLYYEDQKPEALRRSISFVTSRLPKYLEYFDRVIRANKQRDVANADQPWLFGPSLTYADLVLFQCLDGTQHQFTKAMTALQDAGQYEQVFALYAAVKARPRIAAYLASERRVPYGLGVYRHYDELDVLPEKKKEEKKD
ncbi:glutathione s-transferase family [Ophiostoma piceae UAMH 11346]|uniref:Glutathione s-transferase family n=1 Tax=Ophiostoma piceae (strain UAMH 11346) TaxID=1262450 RepID=S3C6X4_OPHP1|nr:glutathione s-transferase family [Ophiostoma piceae UAMH 11346]